jgi:hypothetical protein
MAPVLVSFVLARLVVAVKIHVDTGFSFYVVDGGMDGKEMFIAMIGQVFEGITVDFYGDLEPAVFRVLVPDELRVYVVCRAKIEGG